MGTSAVAYPQFAAILVISLLLGACTQRVQVVRTARGPETERRTVAPDQPYPVEIHWSRHGSTLTGRVSWAECLVDRTWTVTEQRVDRREANRRGNHLLQIVAAAGYVGAVAWRAISTAAVEGEYDCSASGCEAKKPETAGPLILAAVSTGLLIGGIAGNNRNPTERVVSSSARQEHASSRAVCTWRSALAGLELALELPGGETITGRVNVRGVVRFELPRSVSETEDGRELPVTATAVPAACARFIAPGQQVGVVR